MTQPTTTRTKPPGTDEGIIPASSEIGPGVRGLSKIDPDGHHHKVVKITPAHRKIVDLAIEGYTVAQIATMMGRSVGGVGIILGSQVVQDEIARRRDLRSRRLDDIAVGHLAIARETIEEAAVEAAEKLQEQISHGDPKISQSAATKILDLAFGGELEKVAGGGRKSVTIINVDQLKNLNIALLEAGAAQVEALEKSTT
jgi:hypothetical protein